MITAEQRERILELARAYRAAPPLREASVAWGDLVAYLESISEPPPESEAAWKLAILRAWWSL